MKLTNYLAVQAERHVPLQMQKSVSRFPFPRSKTVQIVNKAHSFIKAIGSNLSSLEVPSLCTLVYVQCQNFWNMGIRLNSTKQSDSRDT